MGRLVIAPVVMSFPRNGYAPGRGGNLEHYDTLTLEVYFVDLTEGDAWCKVITYLILEFP